MLKKYILRMLVTLIVVSVLLAAGAIGYDAVNTINNNVQQNLSPNEQQSEMLIPAVSAAVSDEDNLITAEQEQLLNDYALCYANTLVYLEPQDISGLYADTESEAYYLNKTAFGVISTVRNMASKDLKLEECTVHYTVTEAYEYKDKLYVFILEDNTQKFQFLDDISQNFIIQHRFVMENTGDGWRISSHEQEEDFYLLTAEAWENKKGTPQQIADAVMKEITADTQENLIWQKDTYLNKTQGKHASDTSYDRQAAVEYAEKWVGERNYTGVYLAYDEYGGNCQNFASQCLFAGGLDMDYKGTSTCQWKFYSQKLNENSTSNGRSYSWTGVESFYDYCYYNTGVGVVAEVDWGIAYAQKGDVVQVGAMGQWRHSVLVTDVVYDENGYAEEIIIASNTADRINYPLSAYIYTAPRLIHIIGQN